MSALLTVNGLSKTFIHAPKWWWQAPLRLSALSDISFELQAGQTLAVVGESGSGKSTLARILGGLEKPDSGSIQLQQQSILDLRGSAARAVKRDLRMVFQNPFTSLNPRVRIGEQLEHALQHLTRMGPRQRIEAINEALLKVGLQPDQKTHFPHQFSGGQRQRIAIARAVVMQPKVIVADEPVSTLDASVQAQIINLLLTLQRDLGLAYVFISHDLGLVKHVSDHVMVLYGGVIMEYGPAAVLFAQPKHPYTQALLASSPALQRERARATVPLHGVHQSSSAACPFYHRCPLATEQCKTERPTHRQLGQQLIFCHKV